MMRRNYYWIKPFLLCLLTVVCIFGGVFAYDDPSGYKATNNLIPSDKDDPFQRNINVSIPRADSIINHVSVSAEWIDKKNGTGEIHVYLDGGAEGEVSAEREGSALYITTNCNAHGLSPQIVSANIERMRAYGYLNIDYVQLGGSSHPVMMAVKELRFNRNSTQADIDAAVEAYETNKLNYLSTIEFFGNTKRLGAEDVASSLRWNGNLHDANHYIVPYLYKYLVEESRVYDAIFLSYDSLIGGISDDMKDDISSMMPGLSIWNAHSLDPANDPALSKLLPILSDYQEEGRLYTFITNVPGSDEVYWGDSSLLRLIPMSPKTYMQDGKILEQKFNKTGTIKIEDTLAEDTHVFNYGEDFPNRVLKQLGLAMGTNMAEVEVLIAPEMKVDETSIHFSSVDGPVSAASANVILDENTYETRVNLLIPIENNRKLEIVIPFELYNKEYMFGTGNGGFRDAFPEAKVVSFKSVIDSASSEKKVAEVSFNLNIPKLFRDGLLPDGTMTNSEKHAMTVCITDTSGICINCGH